MPPPARDRLLRRSASVEIQHGRAALLLATLIAEESGSAPDAIRPRAAANALLGVHRALIDHVRRRTVTGADAAEIAREVRAQARRAFSRLEPGLGDYAVKGQYTHPDWQVLRRRRR
jgi:hypothetical protein